MLVVLFMMMVNIYIYMYSYTGKYELFIRGGKMINEGDYSEENRFADFSFWVSDNSVKCDTKFHQIDNVSIEIIMTMMLSLLLSNIDSIHNNVAYHSNVVLIHHSHIGTSMDVYDKCRN